MTLRPPFPHVLDSTMMADFKSCPQRFFRHYIEHWKGRGPHEHFHAGACFARGLEEARWAYYERDLPVEESVGLGLAALWTAWGDIPPEPPGWTKTLERVSGALVYHFDQYPLDQDNATPILLPSGRRAIEFSFAEPIDYPHPETGDPLIYCGRSDMIVDFASGIYIEDDKTTKQLGATWGRQWELRSQFTGYTWAARKVGIPVDGVLVRGVAIRKTGYDTLQPITYRANWEIDRWYAQLLRDIARMEQCWRDGWWDYALDHACTEYGGCGLLQICKSPQPEAWLPMSFERRVWDPLTRTETLVEEA